MEKLNNYNFFTQNELKLELVTEYIENHEKLPDSKIKQAGAELCQARIKLGLALVGVVGPNYVSF